MKLTYESLMCDRRAWEEAGVRLPQFDIAGMAERTIRHPKWIHFGAGNIFRAFMAKLQQRLLDAGLTDTGVIAAEAFDQEIIDRFYQPYDNLTMLVTLHADARLEKEIIASIPCAIKAGPHHPELLRMMQDPGLQMISMTITEKGYALTDLKGNYLPFIRHDMEAGPQEATSMMGLCTGLLYHRYTHGAAPLAVVSMDNCARNGEKLEAAVITIAREWLAKGMVEEGFLNYLQNPARITFPWSMIDKITPRPSEDVRKALQELGIEGMTPAMTARHTYSAAFVNAEAPEYLVIEDSFPNGRPPLEHAHVYFTDRDTVNRTERMKVTTCLNPLHTALAVYGCLLGYPTIASEMKDPALRALVEGIGGREGMPVVVHPGILDPEAFLREVLDERLPNPFMPDTPERIATDTSQKIPVRFGETIKAYWPNVDSLHFIPLAIAGWCRYLLGVDDALQPMTLSTDPMLEPLQQALAGVRAGQPETYCGQLQSILSNRVIFGSDLTESPLAARIEGFFVRMLAGAGAVRRTLEEEVL
ncbi:MAG: mannitol dehydrogenase family protein [Firmicutes bacterium]|nr:mannitol dehydrogenase family protein [Bacillota bacterium]